MKEKLLIIFLLVIDAMLIASIYLHDKIVPLFQPKGFITLQQKELLIVVLLLSVVVILPVFILALYVAAKYNAKNTKAAYAPDWDHNHKLQSFIWGFPFAIILILAGITWVSTHELDPRVPLAGIHKPMTIQVVAMRWKWLFIYPEEGIATVNYVVFPEKTPLRFELTAADAPMNSFWIPQLGGQMYAMSGMVNQLHLIADAPGEYRGSDAEISGAGFAGMRFTAKSVTPKDFDTWVASIKSSPHHLTKEEYARLSKPSEDNPQVFYASTADDLYTTIVTKYMAPRVTSSPQLYGEHNPSHSMTGM